MTYFTLIVIIFIVGYVAITLEHALDINKTASALITGVLCWTIFILYDHNYKEVNEHLAAHLGEISQILFFLMGAMTIVELVDVHEGFRIVTDRITTRNSRILLWIIGFITFFLSAALDNLTTSIVMVSLLRKLVHNTEQRKFYAGVVIIAANAGGAWSPIGDVTTTMLWIGGQITAWSVIQSLFIPSLVCLIVPLIYVSFFLKGELKGKVHLEAMENPRNSMIMLIAGVGALIFVPVFKTITHLPPYMGILIGLGVVWVISEALNSRKDEEIKKRYSASYALSRIDTSSVLFFLGILMAIGALEATHILTTLAKNMDQVIGNQDVIILTIGLASSVVDNVPLVAATMGMYPLSEFPVDVKLWQFLAYCAGTGGSILIIGSAAGVAVMGMEKIDFFWYIRRISFVALLGYLAGAFIYLGGYYFL
jgi:Na+/H+ antiporter NhaD/arsenite permease-like protein